MPPGATRGLATGCRQESHVNHFRGFIHFFFAVFELNSVVSASLSDSREETVLGSIPLPSYVISPVEPDDNISRRYAFKVTHLHLSFHLRVQPVMVVCLHGNI